MKEFNIKLNEKEMNIVILSLQKQPYEVVADIMQHILIQLQEQEAKIIKQ